MSEQGKDKPQEHDELSPLEALSDKKVSRREFLKIAGIAGATVGVAGGLGGLVAACGGTAATTTTGAGATTTAGGATTTAGLATTTTAPASTTTTVAVQKGGTLQYAFPAGDPAYIDPYNCQESQGTEVTQAIFDGLVYFDWVTGKITPAVADSWEANADATVWTFHMKQGTKFTNGREVVADDFVYAWNRVANPVNKSDISYHLAPIKGFDEMQAGTATTLAGVVAKDPYTLEVTLSYPWSSFPYVTGHPALSPVPKEEVEKDPKAFLDMPIGNGPFKMAEPWKHAQYIKVVANPDYYGAKPIIDGITFTIFKDEETAFTEFRAGTIDFTTIPSGQIKASIAEFGQSDIDGGLTAAPGKQVLLGPEWAIYYVWINNKDATLSNKQVREAISLAINRQAIGDTVYEGTREPATGPVCKGIPGYEDNLWPYMNYDVEQAKSLLAQAGFPDGKGIPEIKLSFNTGAGHEPVMQLIQSDLAKIGITTKLDGHEWAEYTSSFLKQVPEGGAYVKPEGQQLMRLGWIADYPIIDNFTYPLFQSKSGDNKALYSNPEVDKQLEQARSTPDLDAATALYQQIQKTVGQDTPMLPIVTYRHRNLTSDKVHDFTYSPQGITNFQKVWISG
jgi:oligopeptide transport system substrate-binding protein